MFDKRKESACEKGVTLPTPLPFSPAPSPSPLPFPSPITFHTRKGSLVLRSLMLSKTRMTKAMKRDS